MRLSYPDPHEEKEERKDAEAPERKNGGQERQSPESGSFPGMLSAPCRGAAGGRSFGKDEA